MGKKKKEKSVDIVVRNESFDLIARQIAEMRITLDNRLNELGVELSNITQRLPKRR